MTLLQSLEREEEATAAVNLLVVIDAQRKRAAIEPRQANQHTENISEFSEALEAAIGYGRDVSREAHAQQIGEVEFAGCVGEAQDVAGAAPPGENRLNGVLGAAVAEIAQERVAGAQRQKTESGPPTRQSCGE